MELLIDHAVYWCFIILLMLGLNAAVAKKNLVKKLIGLSIFQTAIILFYVSMGKKWGAGIPIIHQSHGHAAPVEVADILNPVPHVLMLTAIVVGVATTGVALALVEQIYKFYGTTEEDEILGQLIE